EVNGYWMCDLGRFGYHWVESDQRLTRPLVRGAHGLAPAAWHDAIPALCSQLSAASRDGGVRFLTSAHASHEELFLLWILAEGLSGADVATTISVSWRVSDKEQ